MKSLKLVLAMSAVVVALAACNKEEAAPVVETPAVEAPAAPATDAAAPAAEAAPAAPAAEAAPAAPAAPAQ